MSEVEIEERLKELSELKIHPRDKEENEFLLARGERLYEENIGDVRCDIDFHLRQFEDALEKQDNQIIEGIAGELKEFLYRIEYIF